MNKIIIFDTNILTEKRLLKNIKLLIDQHKNRGDIYITETVLDEFTNFNYNLMKTEVVDTLSTYNFMYKLLDIEYDLKKIHSKEYLEDIKSIIKDLFEDNIISLGTIKLEEVYGRAIKKIPPFDSSRPSDNGFKDTLIWLSILNYDYTNYSEIFFITKDKIFKKHEMFFQKEFDKKHNKPIFIFDDLPIENVKDSNEQIESSTFQKSTEDYSESILEDYNKINDFRSELEEVINEIIYIPVVNYDYYEHSELRFVIHEHINIENLESFRMHLVSLVKDNILSHKIKVFDFLSPYCDIENILKNYDIELDSVVRLLKIISEFQKVLPKYTNALLLAINNKINTETYQLDITNIDSINIPDEDLPF